jgi:hypothetical protein
MRRECTSKTTEGLDVPLRAVVGRAHRNENSRSERAQRRLSDVYMLEHRRYEEEDDGTNTPGLVCMQ